MAKNHSDGGEPERGQAGEDGAAQHRQGPAGGLVPLQHQHLGHEHTVEEAPGERVHQHRAGAGLEAERVEAVHGHRAR